MWQSGEAMLQRARTQTIGHHERPQYYRGLERKGSCPRAHERPRHRPRAPAAARPSAPAAARPSEPETPKAQMANADALQSKPLATA